MNLLPLLLTLLLATPVWAANPKTDGVVCASHTANARVPGITRGRWVETGCYNVCDAYAAADTGAACNEFDLNAVGMPDILIFEIDENGSDCSDSGGPTVTITTGPITGGDPAYGPSTSTVVLNDAVDRVTVITKDAMLDRFLFFAVADDTACTDVDVRMHLANRKPAP